MTPRRLVLAAIFSVVSLGCTSFPDIEANECGNAVLEPGEDCDTYIDVAKKLAGASCRPKGVIGECHYDCRVNPDGSRGRCPENMGCASDGICRRRVPGEAYDPPEKLSSDVAAWLTSLDFDGDGRGELLTTEPPGQGQLARFALHYFDDDLDAVETRSFPRLTARPSVREVTGDARDDLFVTNGRIGMLPGRKDREWLPEAFSSYVMQSSRLRVVSVSRGFVSDAVSLASFSDKDGDNSLYLPDGDGGIVPKLPLPHPVQFLLPPIGADIVEGLDSPCDEVVMAFVGDESFRLLDLCQVGDGSIQSALTWREEVRQQTVRLPEGVKLDGAPVSADVDGDGHLDVLIGAGGLTYVTHGDGAGLEASASLFKVPIIDATEPYELPLPLAAGDVTGDGVADFVLPFGVLASRRSLVDQSVGYFVSYSNTGPRWSLAEVADLNGNELLDVIVASAGAPSFTFLSGTGGPFQVPSAITTTGPLRLLASGDFDGDLIRDVALIQGNSPDEPGDFLAVAYGTRDRAPLPPIKMAELDGVQQLGSMHDAAFDDVMATSSARVSGQDQSTFTLFDGSSDQLLLAPYALNTFSKNNSLHDFRAAAIVVGGFTAPGAHDLVALSTSDDSNEWGQWLVPNIGKGNVPPRPLTSLSALSPGVLPVSANEDGGLKLSVAGTSADLEGDGFDEVLWLMPNRRTSTCALLIYDIDGGAESATLTRELDLEEPCPTPELAAADLNVDGWLDLLLLTGDPRDKNRRVELLWNDTTGHFSLEHRSFVGIENHDVRGFSFFPPPAIKLALVSDQGLHIAKPVQDQYSFDRIANIQSFNDARSVLAADLNRDGSTELMVADAEGLWLLRGSLQ
ncbi:MAG TPA: VCBS repeat-containing protein [Polyangiaceae bacterium]|nr:VCBS repeat-containing protein [Polyangiaceae bacterium]